MHCMRWGLLIGGITVYSTKRMKITHESAIWGHDWEMHNAAREIFTLEEIASWEGWMLNPSMLEISALIEK